MFKVGDIVTCLVDRPSYADINKGDKAIITRVEGTNINFKNYPVHTVFRDWLGQTQYFQPAKMVLENK